MSRLSLHPDYATDIKLWHRVTDNCELPSNPHDSKSSGYNAGELLELQYQFSTSDRNTPDMAFSTPGTLERCVIVLVL